ncbi:hypothetical protein [Alienimonas sp. DA493]|uniref:hypothetical protein n=1 Tax=Alienimonas sp. DA493 TaxID=3373605 RepID=UPI0037542BB9
MTDSDQVEETAAEVPLPRILNDRKMYSIQRVDQFRSEVANLKHLPKAEGMCVYTTGSFGRKEASNQSDIDLFFMHLGGSETPLPNLLKTRIDAELIDLTEKLEFPPFSNDGEYLSIHYLDDMKSKMGGPADDFDNLFTARMLLLLESDWIYNEDVYKEVISEVIQSYYRDFHDHRDGFKPLFLTNDIVRFWKTLCLNYEHRRNRMSEDEDKKLKHRIRNLKLKFSRMLTCFSTVAVLVRSDLVATPDLLASQVLRTPMGRLDLVGGDVKGAAALVRQIQEEYCWFLEMTGRNDEEVKEWISDKEKRDAAFERGRKFGRDMYDLILRASEDTETVRYLLV